MSEVTAESLSNQIVELGDRIKQAKLQNKPKEDWSTDLQRMLDAKAHYKQLVGEDFVADAAAADSKKPIIGSSCTEPSEKNKEKAAAKAAAKAEKEAKKAAQRAERERREREKAERLAGIAQENFGDAPMVQSQEITDKVWTNIPDLHPGLEGNEVRIRGHLQTSRLVGKGAFILVRSSLYTVQGVFFHSDGGSSAMVKYISGLPLESVVDITGVVTLPLQPVEKATQKMIEIQITTFYCISKASPQMPFLIEDASRPDFKPQPAFGTYNAEEDTNEEGKASADGLIRVGQEIRLDHRWIDLRTPANQAIFRIESMVGTLFREYLTNNGFVEIHTPKLIGGASEGGSEVFKVDYFGQPACLAMSPQLHKQMAAACSGFERVFETGPVFRAEKSNTRRHLCEFTGFDIEMVIHEHYDEILEVFSQLFIYIFDGISQRCKQELERVRDQHPFEDLMYLKPTLKISYAEGCKLLNDAGVFQHEYEDLSTENEKKLGDIVREKFQTDFFFMDKYPLSVRPFYTMPDPSNPKLSNSYDFFIRGQEILSGAQRVSLYFFTHLIFPRLFSK